MRIDTSGKLPLEEGMFVDATYWHLAARILYAYAQTDKLIPRLPGVPDITPRGAVPLLAVAGPVEAFALELYFKAGSVADGKEPKGSHSIASLFRCLDTLLRRDIQARYEAWMIENSGWEVWWKEQGQSTQFDDIMKDSSDAFDEFRYMAEYSQDANPNKRTTTFKFMAMPVTEATRDALVKRHPEWAKHMGLHGPLLTFRLR